MTLYEIDKSIREFLENNIDPETGELLNAEMLDELVLSREEKIEGIAIAYKNAMAEAEAIKAEKLKLGERQATAEKRAESLKRYLRYAAGGEKFSTPRVTISYRKSEQVFISEDAVIPERYTSVKVTPNKTAIKAAIKAGEKIIGAELVETNNIQVK